MHLQNVIFQNVAPLGNLELNFEKNQVIVLSGINGKGKTTILSYIADAFFEIARAAKFQDTFEDSTRYYRITSPTTIVNGKQYSLVYIRFTWQGKNIDYLEIVGNLEQEEYDSLIKLDNKISFQTINHILVQNKSIKFISQNLMTAQDLFKQNVLTYFPADRLEIPFWLNDTENKKSRFNTKIKFDNHLGKNIESRVIAEEVVNWILDIVLDWKSSIGKIGTDIAISDLYSKAVYDALNELLRNILSEKVPSCRFGIGPRHKGLTRVSIVRDTDEGIEQIVPSITHLSSGEIALLVMFAEIIRQYDAYPAGNSFSLDCITGVVVIDEVDKHLHIKLQRKILPQLIKIFPGIQFIVSSHSPFFALGASETIGDRTRFIDLTIGGKDVAVTKIKEIEDLYIEVLNGNENYKKLYDDLESELAQSKKLRILTEGANVKYIQKAIQLLAPDLLNNIHFCSGIEERTGKEQLKQTYFVLSKTNSYDKTLFVWDSDAKNEIAELIETGLTFKFAFELNMNNCKVKKGIENLFDESLFEDRYYKKKTKIDGYGAESIIQNFDKEAFLKDILKMNAPQTFFLFQPLIEKTRLIIL